MSKKQKKNKQRITRDSTAYTKDEWFGTGKRSRKRKNKPEKAQKQGKTSTASVLNTSPTANEVLENVSKPIK